MLVIEDMAESEWIRELMLFFQSSKKQVSAWVIWQSL